MDRFLSALPDRITTEDELRRVYGRLPHIRPDRPRPIDMALKYDATKNLY